MAGRCEVAAKLHPAKICFNRMETVPFFRLFIREGDIEYTGCGNTEHRGLKARVLL